VKPGSGGAILLVAPPAPRISCTPPAERQPARQEGARVDRLDTETAGTPCRVILRVFDMSDLIAQRIEGGERGACFFKLRVSHGSFLFVLFFPALSMRPRVAAIGEPRPEPMRSDCAVVPGLMIEGAYRAGISSPREEEPPMDFRRFARARRVPAASFRAWLDANLTDDLRVEETRRTSASRPRPARTLERPPHLAERGCTPAGWIGHFRGRRSTAAAACQFSMQQVIFDEEYFRRRARRSARYGSA